MGLFGTKRNNPNSGDKFNPINVVAGAREYPPFLGYLTYEQGTTTLSSSVSLDDTTAVVDDTTGIDVGDQFAITDQFSVYTGQVLSIDTNTITLDTPINRAFASGSTVIYGSKEMAVDGSTTPVKYCLRSCLADTVENIDLVVQEIVLNIITTNKVETGLFGNLTALTNGIYLRYNNGSAFNIFNIKTNNDISAIADDFQVFISANNSYDLDGIIASIKFGISNMGTVIRLKQGETLEMIVQDDLTGLTSMTASMKGHIDARYFNG